MKTQKDQTFLGVDYGERNIGIALGRNGAIAPITTISGKSDSLAIHEITRIAMENRVDKLVVGVPLTEMGRETSASIKIRKFAKLLRILSKKPVVFCNEHSTTLEAREEALSMGIPQKKRRIIDHLSASIILKHFYQEML